MRRALRLLIPVVLALTLLPGTAGATHVPDQSSRMSELFTSPNQATNSDLAFWGKHAFVGYYTGDTGFPAGSGSRGGVRIFDISRPESPQLVTNFGCDANQNDPIVWDRDGNGVADLMLVAVDRTMANPNCGAPRSAHDDRNGWEGVRIFELSDDPQNPFQTVTPLKMQYTDCGAHTITAWTGLAEDPVNPRLIVYVASYPLRAGPTCGQANFSNVTNPYDEDKVVNDPLHRQIQVLSVPLNNPAATTEIAQPPISYPGDPDGRIDWCERNLCGLEPAAVACHGIVVNWVDESFGSGCPTMTPYQPRPWNPAGGTHKTGRMFFSDMEGNFLSEFHVGDLRPDPGATEYCSAHMGMAIMGIQRDLLVNAWYTGGADVIDFTDAENLQEVAFYDPQQD